MMKFAKLHPWSWTSRLICAIALGSGVAGLGGCASDRAVIGQANQVHDGLKPAVIQDAELSGYLQAIGDRIITAARELDSENFGPKSHRSESSDWMFSKDMKFHFVNSKTLNAFTTGGEHMYIYSELFQQCKNEDELAAVMAHVYGHVYARHVQKGMDRQYYQLGAMIGAGAAGYALGGKESGAEYGSAFAGAAGAAGQFIGNGYTRKDEAQADELGFAFYTHAGWDPTRFADFFKQMIAAGYDKTPEVLSDHPSLASRVEDAEKRVKALPPQAKNWRKPPVADAAKFKALQARSVEVGKSMPSDKQTQGAQQLLAAFSNCFTPVPTPDQVTASKHVQQASQTSKKKKSK